IEHSSGANHRVQTIRAGGKGRSKTEGGKATDTNLRSMGVALVAGEGLLPRSKRIPGWPEEGLRVRPCRNRRLLRKSLSRCHPLFRINPKVASPTSCRIDTFRIHGKYRLSFREREAHSRK